MNVRSPASWGLAPRLLVAIALVLATASVTAWIVAGAVGPSIFQSHIDAAGADPAVGAAEHAEIAFRTASAIAVSLALALGVAVALTVSVVVTRRIGRSLDSFAGAARRIAGGAVGVRVPPPRLGREFDALAGTLNTMADRLDRADRLRAQLLSDVAHELRTPVATIDATLEALEDGIARMDDATVAVLRSQGARLVRLSEDLAAVTRAESGSGALRRERLDVASSVADALRARAAATEARNVDLRWSTVRGRRHLVDADPDRLAQVWGNLLDNAVRHSRAGGRVTVEVTASDREDAVTVTVSDDGDGIAPEHLPHVFERFYRADAARDRDHGGSGIGLAIVKAIVEAHGGTVTAASDGPGRGARFAVTLPARPPARD